ncbi:tyrosine-type recombinase/integrase [Microvirga sp. 3-52]|uniref:site-specific integrase n=1 Tax=Microvirga sp. 3-52 TaxID=2792425 RepID=UPI001AC815FF|nr:site-specific integrase [Microvirga sp. 3-52]MBO1909472.1 tyrosine-type recombinase/integrase [Microvirga sp. 3-52]MBS7455464.1 tyrosine-type recombinase/integrase [Microvirga sp. 3-52]
MPEAATKITKAAVDRLAPGEIIWDVEIRGFGVRCQRRDRVYLVKYRSQARQRWYTIGKHGSPWTPELARREAKRILGLVAEGKDPADKKQKDRSAPTLSALADRFLEEHVEAKSKDRTYTEYKRLIERVVKPELGRLKIDEVRSSDIERLHLKFRATPYQANRLVALLSKMFNWSGRRGERNPCVGIERFAEQMRRRYLSSAELARLGTALTQAEEQKLTSPYVVAAIRLLVFTGARLTEILTLRWDHIDLERHFLNLADSKTGAKTIYLNAASRNLLATLPRLDGNPFVIPGERVGKHLVNLEKPWRKVRNLAQLPDVRLHDLRHSFASIGAGAGLGLPVIGALLGHAQAATTARYAHLASDPLQQAADLIGERLAQAMLQT